MKNRLHALSASLSIGTVWALVLFGWTIIAAQNGYGASVLDLLSEIYPSYEVSVIGAVWGLLWGFVDAFIGTYVVVWLYNHFVAKFTK